MDEQTRAEIDAQLEMCEHPGWKVLMRATQEQVDAFRAGTPFNMKTEADLYFARGVMSVMHEILSLKERLEASLVSGEDADESGTL